MNIQIMKTNFRSYLHVFTTVVALLFLQFDANAQERKSFTSIDKSSNDNIIMTWNKSTPESEMKDDIKALAEKGITIKYSNVKRNAKDEIVAIKVEYSDRKGNKGKMELENQNPINTITFFKQDDEIGFGEPSNSNGFAVNPFNGFAGGDSFMKQFNLGNMPDMQSFNFSFPDGEGNSKSKSKIMIQKDGRKPLVIEDGEVTQGAEDYTPEEIEEIKKSHKVESFGGDGNSFNFNFNSDSQDDIKKQFEKLRKMNDSDAKEENSNDAKELEKTKDEMIKAKEEMMKAKEEMEKAKKDLEKAKSSLKVQKI
jgi:hypothetical protein